MGVKPTTFRVESNDLTIAPLGHTDLIAIVLGIVCKNCKSLHLRTFQFINIASPDAVSLSVPYINSLKRAKTKIQFSQASIHLSDVAIDGVKTAREQNLSVH